ncbi:C40 family peptidase [Streptomyces sp. Z26]|uniref:C40 family peptidase n=1 Tax=Streptomyces sp. Z26 TaxID=2500177 RepID=UPI001F0C5518|nr:C40 family peptidase [Streptomyces sp. Z26]
MSSHRSHRRPPRPGTGWPARVTVLTAAASAVAALTSSMAAAEPDEGKATSSGTAGARVDRLYEQAERATDKYNGAAERVTTLRKRVEQLQDEAARGQAKVNRLRNALGSLAGAQYRSGAVDPTVALILSSDPDGYLDRAATLDRVGDRQRGQLREFESARRALEQRRTEAAGTLERLGTQRAELLRHKKSVQAKLRSARRLLDRLTPDERAERDRASRGVPRDAAPGGAEASSGRASSALAAAQRAVGSPYGWGQAGPSSFDCSGLTQWAYGQAGTSIPRTSQAQRSAGSHVPLSQARPGDLVIYRADASHVAMYAGNGQVVHAPQPGAQVRYDPVGMMPVSAVVRP